MATDWFVELYCFTERAGHFSANKEHLRFEDGYLVCDSAPGEHKRQWVGSFTTPSLEELRLLYSEAEGPARAGCGGGLTYRDLVGDAGKLHRDPANARAVFQVASQFNCLEMVSPEVTPEDGVTGYAWDLTQGPACALACPAATVHRNYFALDGAGQSVHQINCLADVEQVLGAHGAWTMQNGYCLPQTPTSIGEVSSAIAAGGAELKARAEAALRVGVNWDAGVAPPATHRVTQVFCSALPVAYDRKSKNRGEAWEAFARLVLTAAYDATLCVGRQRAAQLGRRCDVYLTALGGGAFGNAPEWIVDAVREAVARHADAPLDVHMVHYRSIRAELALADADWTLNRHPVLVSAS